MTRQLDLVVVGDQQPAAGGGDEGPPEAAALLGAHGDVVEVGWVRRQAAGAGHGLVERGVDPPVGAHLGEQALAIGRAQLLDLAVAQERLDDGVLAEQLLQRGGVGREAGLRLLLGLQAELLEQDVAQLRRGVDLESSPAWSWIVPLERPHLGRHLVVERSAGVHVDADADPLHAGQHPHQGALDPVVEGGADPGRRAPPRASAPGGRRPPPGGRPSRPDRSPPRPRSSWPAGSASAERARARGSGVRSSSRYWVSAGSSQVGGDGGVDVQACGVEPGPPGPASAPWPDGRRPGRRRAQEAPKACPPRLAGHEQ